MEILRTVLDHVMATALVFEVSTIVLANIYRENSVTSIDNLVCTYSNRAIFGNGISFGFDVVGSSLGKIFPNSETRSAILDVLRNKRGRSVEDRSIGEGDLRIFSIADGSRGEFLCVLIHESYNPNSKFWKNRNDFLATVSHELRTPLNGIIGMGDLFMDTYLSEEQFDYINTIRQCSYSLMSTLNDVLDFTKLEAGTMKLDNAPFSLRECIDGAFDVVSTKIKEKNLDLVLTIEPDVPPFLRGDIQRIRQILINLISNSIKYTESKPGKQGRITVGVRSKRLEKIDRGESGDCRPPSLHRNSSGTTSVTRIERKKDSGEVKKRRPKIERDSPRDARYEITFTVTDNGVGMDRRTQAKLFSNLLPVASPDDPKVDHAGAGLGLAITKHLAVLMGGHIRVDSEPNLGSSFHVTIVIPEYQEGLTTISDPAKESLMGKNILIVDENTMSRLSMTQMLLKWKMKPTSCASPDEALVYLNNSYSFDAAFIDISKPDAAKSNNGALPRTGSKTDGMILAEQFRTAGIDIPLVALFSFGEEAPATGNRSVFRTYILKPVKENKLYNVCVDIFGGQNTRTSGKSIDGPLRPDYNISILSVDDLPTNQKVITSMLSRLGYNNVDSSRNADETLKKVAEKKYDLILLDLRMPTKDGYTVAREIYRTYKKESRPYIVGCTITRGQAEKHKYAKYIDSFLTKPIFIDSLEKVLYRMALHRKAK